MHYETDNEGTINGNELYDCIMSYGKSYDAGTLPVKDGTISADLFESDIDEERKTDSEQGKIQKGFSYYDFDADTDIQKLVSWQDGDPSFWDNWNEFGFWDVLFGNIPSETGREISTIQVLKESDLSGTDKEISERLLVNIKDVEDLKAAYEDAVTVKPLNPGDEECYLVLFRFATSDYYSAPMDIYESDFLGYGTQGAGICGKAERVLRFRRDRSGVQQGRRLYGDPRSVRSHRHRERSDEPHGYGG